MSCNVIFVIDSELTFTEAPPSRFFYIAKALQRKGFKIEVLGRKGEKIHSLKTHQINGPKNVSRLKIIFHVYAKTLTHDINVIIVRGSLLAFFLLPIKILGKRLILDFHGWLHREIKIFYENTICNKIKVILYYLIEKINIRHFDTIICVSEGIRNSLGREKLEKTIILENGIDIHESKKIMELAEKEKDAIYSTYLIPTEKSVIGFLGNWERQLDMETMFRGAKIAGVPMVVIGEGPNINEYKKTWENVRFLGKQPKPTALEIIHLCKVAIAPYKKTYATTSYWSQRKVKDYLSLGKPIIMADVKEREQFLIPNKNVLLYEPGNAEDLADKIKTLISNEKLAKEMSQNNLKLAQRFDWDILIEESGLIEKILKN